MHPFTTQRLAKLPFQKMVHTAQDEVHDLYRCVDDPQPIPHLGKGLAEELLIKLDHNLLLASRIVNAFGPQLHTVVELLQRTGFLVQVLLFQDIQHLLHGQRHWVLAGEAMV